MAVRNNQINHRATIADVAKLAGVSKMAVSAVLNKSGNGVVRVSGPTAERIRATAKSLGYAVNAMAQSLATGRTGFIGFMLSSSVSHGFMNPYFAEYLQGIETECRKRSYGLAISRTTIADASKFINSNIIGQRRIDGLIVTGELKFASYKILNSAGIPYIALNALADKGIPTFGSAVSTQKCFFKFAASTGHKRVIYTVSSKTTPETYEALLSSSKESAPDVEFDFFAPAPGQHPNWEPDFGLGRHLFEHWASVPPGKRATLIFSNGILPEFYDELLNAGFKCPEDVSLVGENSLKTYRYPKFTLFCGSHEKEGADAAGLVIDAVEKASPVDLSHCDFSLYAPALVQGRTLRMVS